LIRTLTDLPLLGLDTFTTVPKGSVFDAAVKPLGLYLSPLLVMWPANARPYQDTLALWTRVRAWKLAEAGPLEPAPVQELSAAAVRSAIV
jgi:hypothetical protein